jgi:uncharacterized protein (TIGR02266 family)
MIATGLLSSTTDPRPESRRTNDRVDAEFEITAQSENNFYRGLSENISVGGLFFETYAPHHLGEQLTVRFTLPGTLCPIEATVVVRWIRAHNPASDTPQGIGVQFIGLDADARRVIERFSRKRDPLFYEAG